MYLDDFMMLAKPSYMFSSIPDYDDKLGVFISNCINKGIYVCEHRNVSDLKSWMARSYMRIIKKFYSDKGIMSYRLKQKLYIKQKVDFVLSKLYGTIKVHKENNPIRPVVSTIGHIGWVLQKFIKQIFVGVKPDFPHDLR